MTVILDDLSTLPPKKLAKRLEELAAEALPCLGISALEASPAAGLTTALWVDDRGRHDIHDLVRVIETEPGGYATVAWAALSPSARTPFWRLLLRVRFERPVQCEFDVRIDVEHATSLMPGSRVALLLAAESFALQFYPTEDGPSVVVPAPTSIGVIRDVVGS